MKIPNTILIHLIDVNKKELISTTQGQGFKNIGKKETKDSVNWTTFFYI